MDMSEGRRLAGQDFDLVPRTRIFFKAEGLPEKAGKAQLQFVASLALPERDKECIKLPSRQGELVYHALRGGHQFLVEVGGQSYFGGTDELDESVFLVEVTKEALAAFADGGETGFYDSLKPAALKQLEEKNPAGETRRQGDIFAFWCANYGKSVHGLIRENVKEIDGWYGTTSIKVTDTDDPIQFNGTRHVVKGREVRIAWVAKDGAKGEVPFYTGEMHAPDHKPLVFGKRPHRLFQAVNIVRPRPGCGDR